MVHTSTKKWIVMCPEGGNANVKLLGMKGIMLICDMDVFVIIAEGRGA